MDKSKHDILRLMNEYCYTIDGGDLDGFASLFEHGVFQVIGEPGGALKGKSVVRKMLQGVTLYDGKPQTKHVLSNVQIDVEESGDTASAQSYITVFQALPPDFPLQPIFMGHYYDVFEKAAGTWRFCSRKISPDLIGDLSRHRADMA